ncbi:MAG: methyltransferase domain-containing protein [Clostridiales bacterium]|jgi:trans-aconitate methyltransferase|nr:methyltransferase domain-containing protein [Clostridiales bacterium]
MKWNADLYNERHNYSSGYGAELLNLVPKGLTAVLDVGCGTGDLTARLCGHAQRVVGIDSSPDMLALARQNHHDVEFILADAENLDYNGEFDAVFSNAAFHWIADQNRLLSGICRALKPRGILVCEFGAHGNVAAIRNAYRRFADSASDKNKWFFPTADRYRALLTANGFKAQSVVEFDRPTPLSGGENGLENWTRQFYADAFNAKPKAGQAAITAAMKDLLRPLLWDAENSCWIADYRRLRAVAEKN